MDTVVHLYWGYLHRRNYADVANNLNYDFFESVFILHYLNSRALDTLGYIAQWILCVGFINVSYLFVKSAKWAQVPMDLILMYPDLV